MMNPASRAGEGRGTLFGIGIGIGIGLVLIGLIVAGRASAHPDVIDFRQTCSGHRADGHNHADIIYGSRICRATPDHFRGLFGPDRIYGYWGSDTLLKGAKGDDFVSGGPGRDWVEGSNGVDTLRGGPQPDHIEGGLDGDRIRGDGGGDKILGMKETTSFAGGPEPTSSTAETATTWPGATAAMTPLPTARPATSRDGNATSGGSTRLARSRDQRRTCS